MAYRILRLVALIYCCQHVMSVEDDDYTKMKLRELKIHHQRVCGTFNLNNRRHCSKLLRSLDTFMQPIACVECVKCIILVIRQTTWVNSCSEQLAGNQLIFCGHFSYISLFTARTCLIYGTIHALVSIYQINVQLSLDLMELLHVCNHHCAMGDANYPCCLQ